MKKGNKKDAEFRFYEKPQKEPILALLGEKWNRDYEGGELHFHNMLEIGYCYKGEGIVILNGEEHRYGEGTFTFIPHNILHTTKSFVRSQWEFLYFDIEEVFGNMFQSEMDKKRDLMKCVNELAVVLSKEQFPMLGTLFLMIFELAHTKGNYYIETTMSALFTAAMQIVRMSSDGNQVMGKSRSGSKITPALTYIRNNYKEDIKINELAEICHFSETHFRRIFMAEMNMSPIEYVNLIRVQMSCELMKQGYDNMEQVAEMVGYRSISTFNRNFKQIIGNSPYQWKKQMESGMARKESYHIRARKGWDF